jgi:hypothetical protein
MDESAGLRFVRILSVRRRGWGGIGLSKLVIELMRLDNLCWQKKSRKESYVDPKS